MTVGSVFRATLLFGIGVIAGLSWAALSGGGFGWWQREAELDPSLPYAEIATDAIPWLVYSNPSMTMTAQRTINGADFAIQVTYADSRAPERCISSPDLGGLLGAFAQIKVKRQIKRQDIASGYPIALGTVELKGFLVNEPARVQHYFVSRDGRTVATEQDTATFETEMSPQVFKKLGSGCASLAKR